MASTDGMIPVNTQDVYERLSLFSGAIRGMIVDLQSSGQQPIANRLNEFVNKWGIGKTTATLTTHTKPTVGRPVGQQMKTNSGQFGARPATSKKKSKAKTY